MNCDYCNEEIKKECYYIGLRYNNRYHKKCFNKGLEEIKEDRYIILQPKPENATIPIIYKKEV